MTAVHESFEDFEARYEAEMTAAVAALDPAWGIKGYRGHNTHDGVAWVAKITFNGKVVGSAEDAGQGGSPSVYFDGGWNGPVQKAFDAEAAKLFGDKDGWRAEGLIEAILIKAGK